MFVENDDFTTLDYWDTINGELINEELVHHIPVGSSSYYGVYSTFNGVNFPGDSSWSVSIDYRIDIADILNRGYDPNILRFRLDGGGFSNFSLEIVGADVGDASGDIRTQLASDLSSSIGNTPWVYSAPFSGTITMSHDGVGGLTISGAGYSPQVFSGVVPSDKLFSLKLSSSITTNTWDEIKVAFDNLTSTGGVATEVPDPVDPVDPVEGAMNAGFGLKSIFGGLSTGGATLGCGLSIAVEMTGGRESLTANLLCSLGIECSISGDQPAKGKMRTGMCLTCLMRAKNVPQNVLQYAFALGVEMKAGQSGQNELAGGLFIGCKMGGTTGALLYPCLSREFSHMDWF